MKAVRIPAESAGPLRWDDRGWAKPLQGESPMERVPMPRHLAMVATLLFLTPVLLWAQDPQEPRAPQERIDAAFERVEGAGVPTSLLESKVAEGRAKGIPMDRIAQAVENRAEALERAREVMARGAPDVDAPQIAVGADALGAGVSEAVLEEIATSAPRERRSVAVAALTHLVAHDVAPEDALQQVQAALDREIPGLGHLPGVAGPPSGLVLPGMGGPPAGIPGPGQVGPPSGVPSPGQGGGPPDDPPRGPPGGGPPGGGSGG